MAEGPYPLGRLGWLIAAGAVALVLIGLYVAASPEVLEKGQLLSYTTHTVWRVRLFDAFDVWVAKETVAPPDVVNGLILAAGAGMAAMGVLLTGTFAPRTNRFFVLFALGLAYLAADEQLALHETLGYNLDFLARAPGTNSPEHVLFALYAVPAVAFFIFYWDLLLASHWGARLMAAGVLLFVVAAGLDVVDSSFDEQWIEPVASTALVGGFALVAVRQLSWSAAAASLRPDAADTRGDRSPSPPA